MQPSATNRSSRVRGSAPARSRVAGRCRAARLCAALLIGLPAALLQAQPCAELPAERTVSDGRSGCLAVVPVAPPPGADRPRVLVVMIHGDRTGSLEQRHVDRWVEVGRALQAADRRALLLIRPGYRTPAGDSSGWANPRDDDYTAENTARVAGALVALRQTLQPQRIVLVGHSGGAATAALVLGRHPGAADAALLLGCPCDLPPWRDHRNLQRGGFDRAWSHSLNPLAFVSGIVAATPVHVATGARDDNTLSRFAISWVERAAARGVAAAFEEVPGHDHGSILRWDGIAPRVQALIAALPD
jgi:pimeloyl-ACP methyl ester carboxylesterase